MKYNALVLEKYFPTTTSIGTKRFAGKFIIIDEDKHPITITAAQFDRPIPAKVGDEIILDVVKKGPFYNILPKTSYDQAPFPVARSEYHYDTVLDEKGHDKDGKVCAPEHPFANVIIKQTKYMYKNTCLAVMYKIIKIDDNDITHPKIFNMNPTICSPDDQSDQRRLIEALRDYLPYEEHPNKLTYTPTEIFKHYREATEWRGGESNHIPWQYGSDRGHCICGHAIEELCYCEYMSPLGEDGIKKMPLGAVGNCCIKHMSYDTKLYTRLLSAIICNYESGALVTARDISKKNGFGKIQMQFLQQCVLTKDEYERLVTVVSVRTITPLDDCIKRILYKISRFYVTHYDYVFDGRAAGVQHFDITSIRL